MFWFLTSSSTTRLHRGRVPRLGQLEGLFVLVFNVLVNNSAISRTGARLGQLEGFFFFFLVGWFGFLKSSSTTRLYRGPVPSLSQLEGLFVWLGFLTSSSTTGLYRGPVPSLGQLEGLFIWLVRPRQQLGYIAGG